MGEHSVGRHVAGKPNTTVQLRKTLALPLVYLLAEQTQLIGAIIHEVNPISARDDR